MSEIFWNSDSLKTQLYIDGAWRPGSDGAVFDVVNPAEPARWQLQHVEAVELHHELPPPTMECNPGTASAEQIQAYFQAGVNRLSIGV